MVIMMTIKYELQFFFFELTDNDGQNFLAGIVPSLVSVPFDTPDISISLTFFDQFNYNLCHAYVNII
jgi:hypothetical protein